MLSVISNTCDVWSTGDFLIKCRLVGQHEYMVLVVCVKMIQFEDGDVAFLPGLPLFKGCRRELGIEGGLHGFWNL